MELLNIKLVERSSRRAIEGSYELVPFPMRRLKDMTLKSYGDRAFAVCGPVLWNAMPPELKCITVYESFKSSVKTYLFKSYFNVQ